MTDFLSDNQPIEVRRLKFLELEDQVSYNDPGLYIHVYVVDGHDQPVGYSLNDFGEIPDRPKMPRPEVKDNTEASALWEQYSLYRAVLLHERKRHESQEQYLIDCARYILDTCVSQEDRSRVITSDDFKLVYRLALCPEVTEEDIMAVLANTFQGYLEGQAFVDLSQETGEIGRILFSDQALGTSVNVKTWFE